MTRYLASLGVAFCLAGCAWWPTNDQTKLKALHLEAKQLMATHRGAKMAEITEADMPPTISSLQPDIVYVSPEGVDIVTKAYFDGGWGYYVPKDPAEVPFPERYRAIGQGVYWFHPC